MWTGQPDAVQLKNGMFMLSSIKTTGNHDIVKEDIKMSWDNIKDFIYAALPWIAIGLFLAIFFARKKMTGNKKAEDNSTDNHTDYTAEGMSIGMCFGAAIGAANVINIGTAMCLGMLIGLIIGMQIKK